MDRNSLLEIYGLKWTNPVFLSKFALPFMPPYMVRSHSPHSAPTLEILMSEIHESSFPLLAVHQITNSSMLSNLHILGFFVFQYATFTSISLTSDHLQYESTLSNFSRDCIEKQKLLSEDTSWSTKHLKYLFLLNVVTCLKLVSFPIYYLP